MPCTDLPSALERGEMPPAVAEGAKREDDIGKPIEGASPVTTSESGGMPGLAFLMTENDQHNFHHCYETPAVEVLLQSSWSINRKIRRLRRIQRRRPRPPDSRKTGTTRKEKRLIDQLRSELIEYYDLFIKLNTVVEYHIPEEGSVAEVMNWANGNFPAWENAMKENPAREFRRLWQEQGKIDKFMANVPKSKLGRFLFKPFETKRRIAANVEIQSYNHVAIFRISMGICLLISTIFFQVPVAVLSYRVLNRGIAVGLALGFCFLFTLFAQWLIPHKPEFLFVLVFTYGAIISGSVFNFDNN